MPKEHLDPATLFPSLQHRFSQTVTARGGQSVYISGQTAWDAEKRILGRKNLGAQASQALRNVRLAVEAAGGTMAAVVSLRICIVDCKPEDAAPLGEALRAFFPGKTPPASTWPGVAGLAVEEFMPEIEAIAVVE